MLRSLAHYSVRAADLGVALAFYTQILGLKAGPRPPFDFPGAWLHLDDGALTEQSCVHLIGAGEPTALQGYLGARRAPATAHTGALDHIAFFAGDWAAMRARLEERGVAFTERSVPMLGLHQVFLTDPDGVTIELNYLDAPIA